MSNNPYKLEVKLKQHTPIIHFQHDQAGATLRASEVKPKLDKFIMEELLKKEGFTSGNGYNEYRFQADKREYYDVKKAFREYANTQKQEWLKWLGGNNNHIALKYQIHIGAINQGVVDRFIVTSYMPHSLTREYENEGFKVIKSSPYFADNNTIKKKDLAEARLGLKANAIINLKIISNHPELIKCLDEFVKPFFVVENFGSRQNKGFGCFMIEQTTRKEFEDILKKHSPIAFSLNNIKGQDRIFENIDRKYKELKAGVRGRDSELRRSYNQRIPMIEWEKPEIQEVVANISGRRLRIDKRTDNTKFIRAVLGLTEIYEYPKVDGIKARPKHVPNNKSSHKIERYKSPVCFKVFNDNIYLTCFSNEYPDVLRNQKFAFEFEHRGKLYGDKLFLVTPDSFEVETFLKDSLKGASDWIQLV